MSTLDNRIILINTDTYNKLLEIERLAGEFGSGSLYAPALLSRLQRSVLITSTGASTRIEGSKLSDEEIEALIKGVGIHKLINRDQQEVQGYYELMTNIFDSWRDIEFNEATIKQFNNILLRYVDKEEHNRGNYKRADNSVGMVDGKGKLIATVFKTTLPAHTPEKMKDLVTWTNNAFAQKKHPAVLVVANFIVEYLAIHPFQDGNGRSSRALTNLLLLKSNYGFMPYVSHEKFIEDNKTDYYLALRQSQKTFGTKNESITPWLNFFMEVIRKQATQASALLSKENIEIMLSGKQQAVWNYLQDVPEASIDEIFNATKIKRPTVKQAMDKLIKLKKVEKIGYSVATRYRKCKELVDYKLKEKKPNSHELEM